MAQGVASTNPGPFATTEGATYKTKYGQVQLLGGVFYDQYGASTGIASTTGAVSLFSGATAIGGASLIPAGGLTLDAAKFIANAPGTIIRGKIVGTLKTSGTPNLTITAGLIQGASTYTAYSTTGALALVSTPAAFPFTLDVWYQIQQVGAAGTASILCGGVFTYNSATNAHNALYLANTVTTATLSTLTSASIEVQAAFGTAHADNQVNVLGAWFEMLS